VCDSIGIPLKKINFTAENCENVFEHFLIEYKAGRTPNPDILCKKEIKFKAFLSYVHLLGGEYIAPGHYAQSRLAADGSV
ncbi:tRNA 2-thiouridine(34) synthase MnmA, partial [Francisella tularensis subsp. holarctica]|nr:tRNA 2-thiouridine(34) synthase MnmA [Francisella tularensis subsp. holarctica]